MNDSIEEIKYQELDGEQITLIIPQCCREGWDSCIHLPKRQRKQKSNVGL